MAIQLIVCGYIIIGMEIAREIFLRKMQPYFHFSFQLFPANNYFNDQIM